MAEHCLLFMKLGIEIHDIVVDLITMNNQIKYAERFLDFDSSIFFQTDKVQTAAH